MKKSIGTMVDELITVNLKMYNYENLKRDPNASDKVVADATRKTNVLNSQRHALIDSLDQACNELAEGTKQQLFGSNKAYGKGR